MKNLLSSFGNALLGKPAAKVRPPDSLWDDDIPIPPDHPLVPQPIRADAAQWLNEGCLLHRVQTDKGIEWWVLDSDGELVEALRLK